MQHPGEDEKTDAGTANPAPAPASYTALLPAVLFQELEVLFNVVAVGAVLHFFSRQHSEFAILCVFSQEFRLLSRCHSGKGARQFFLICTGCRAGSYHCRGADACNLQLDIGFA